MAHAVPMTPEQVRAARPQLGTLGARLGVAAGVVGLAGLAASAGLALTQTNGAAAFQYNYLVALVYFVSISLGALFFVILQHLTRASWSVVIRRLAENLALALPFLALLTLPVVIPALLGNSPLFPWLNASAAAGDYLIAYKQPYLNLPFFLIRLVLYFGVWTVLAGYFARASVRQDNNGDAQLTLRQWRFSAPAMVIFALSCTLFSIDMLMAVDPHWYSTIFGVYFFSGCVIGIVATLTLAAILLQSAGRLRGMITVEHYHDLGKLLFAFTFFWGYIAFSQFMLYWYANIPEETGWYARRLQGEWLPVAVTLLFFHLLVPFTILLSRLVKRRKRLLAPMCVWMLAAHWLDLYWLVLPEYSARFGGGAAAPGLLALTTLIGVGGLWLAWVVFSAGRQSLIPLQDPLLADSLKFENV